MAAEITVPVKLEVLQGSISEIKNILSNLKPNSSSWKELSNILRNMEKGANNLQIAFSKPFGSQSLFNSAEKLINNIEDALSRARIILLRVNFSDLNLNPNQLNTLNEFKTQLEAIEAQARSFKATIKQELQDSSDWNNILKLDPNAVTHSYDEIVTAVLQRTRLLESEKKKAEDALTLASTATQRYEKTLSFFQSRDLKTGMGEDFSKFFILQANGITRFKSGQQSPFYDWIQTNLRITPSQLEELKTYNANQINTWILNFDLSKIIDSVNRNMAKKNIAADSLKGIIDLLSIALQVLQVLSASNGKISLNESNLRPLIEALTASENEFRTSIENAARALLSLLSAFGTTSTACSLLKYALLQTNAEYMKISRTTNMILGIRNTILNFMGFTLVLNLTKKAVQEAANHIKELDTVMNKIAIVTNMDTSDLWGLIDLYSKMALSYGTTIKGAYEVSLIYYQQGLGTSDVLTLTNETLKLAKISGLDYATTTDYMTTAIRGFKMEMQDAASVVDVYSALAANTAVSLEELAVAMSKTASSMESVGSTFEETSAMIGTMVAVTRESATNIGSAMKSIASRYGELTKDPTILKDAEGEAISFNKVDTALLSVGISMKTVDGQFRNFTDVIIELGEKWDLLDSTLQRYIATLFAGNRQQSRFLALVGNVDLLKSNLNVAENSEDTGTVQALKSLDSLESKINLVLVAYQQFYTNIGAESAWKGALDIIKNYINMLNNLPKLFGKVPVGAVSMIADAIALIRNMGDLIINWIGSLYEKILLKHEASTITESLVTAIGEAIARSELVAREGGAAIGTAMKEGMEAAGLPNVNPSQAKSNEAGKAVELSKTSETVEVPVKAVLLPDSVQDAKGQMQAEFAAPVEAPVNPYEAEITAILLLISLIHQRNEANAAGNAELVKALTELFNQLRDAYNQTYKDGAIKESIADTATIDTLNQLIQKYRELADAARDAGLSMKDGAPVQPSNPEPQLPAPLPVTENIPTQPVLAPTVDAGQIQAQIAALLLLLAAYASLSSALSSTSGLSFLRLEEIEKAKTTIEEITQSPLFSGSNMALGSWETVTTNLERLRELAKELGIDLLETGAQGAQAGTTAAEGQTQHEGVVQRLTEKYELLKEKMLNLPLSSSLFNNSKLSSFASGLRMLTGLFDLTSLGGKAAAGSIMLIGGALQVISNIGKSNPFIAIASGIMAIVNGISTLYESPAERLERLETTATELSNKAKELKVDTKDLELSKNKIESLEKARYESAEAAEEYLEAADELADKFPILISGFDDAGNAIIDVTRMEDELANARRETAEATLKAAKAERDAKVEKLKDTGNDIVNAGTNFVSEADSTTTQEDLAIVSLVREWNADLLHRALLSLISGNAYANSGMVTGLNTTYDSLQVLAGADEFLNAIMVNASEQLLNHLAQYYQEGNFNIEEVYSSFFNKFGELIETNGKVETYGITEDQFFNLLSFLEAFRAPTEQSAKDNLTIATKLSDNIDFTKFQEENQETINFEDDAAVLSGIYQKFTEAFTNWDIENIQKYYALYETAIATLNLDGQFYLRNKSAIENLQEKLGPLMATFRQTYGEYNSANKQIISSFITGLKYTSAQYDAIDDLNFLSESDGLTAILSTDLENKFKKAQEQDPNLLMENWLKTDGAMGDIDIVNDFWKNWAGKYINGEVAHEVIDGMLKDTTHYSALDIIAKLGLEEDDPFTGYLINAYKSRAEQIKTSINTMLDKYGKNSKGVQLLKTGVVELVHDNASRYGIQDFDFTYIDQSFLDLASTEILALESLGLYETALNYSQSLIRLYQYLQYETEEVRNAVLDAFVKNGGNTTTGVSAMVTAAKNAGMEDTSKIEALGEYVNLSFSLLALAVANEFIEKWGKEGQKLYSNLRSGLDISLVDEILDLAKNMDFDLSQDDLLADGLKFVLSAENTVKYLNAYKDYLHGSAALTVEFENALRAWHGDSQTASDVEDVLTKEFWADTLLQDLSEVTGLVQEEWITLFNQLGINITDYADKIDDKTYQWKLNINTDAIIDLFNATYDSVAYAQWLMESAIMSQLKAAQWDTGDYSSLTSVLNEAFKGRTNDEIKTELYKLAAGIGDLSILDTFPDVKSAVDHISKAELDAASRLTANFDNLKSAFDQLSSIGIGSVVTGRLRYELEQLSMVDDNGVVNSTFDLVKAYQAIYEKMSELNTATIAELNSAYATLLSAEDQTNIDITSALKNASGMSYNEFGQLLSRYNIKLESLLQNELTAYMAGIERTGFGLIRIKNWEAFAKTVFNTNDLDALRNNPEYISAFKAYNDGLIELNKNAEDAIVEEVSSLKNMKRGSLINLTNFYVRLLQAALEAIDEVDFSSLLNTNVPNLGERLIVSGTEMMLHFPKDNFIPKDYATIYGSTSAMREKFSSAPNIAAVFALIDEAGEVVDNIDTYINELYEDALNVTAIEGLDHDPEAVIKAILQLDKSRRNLAIDIREYADTLSLDEVFDLEDAIAIGAHLKEEATSLLRALNYILEGYGATFEEGILTLSDDANLFGVAATIRDMVDIAGIEIADNLAEIKDAINDVLKSYSDAIKKGIQGGMTNVEALNLTSYAKDLGLNNELLFTQTTEGLKLSNRSARELYSAIKDIDAIQGQIVFDELKLSLIESDDHFKSIASTTAYIKLLREGTAYPDNSKRIADLEEELALAERIQAERATSEDSSYNFMDNDIPAGQQNMLNYWSNWSDAFEAIKNSTKGGKAKNTIGYLDFYNIVTEMGNLADLTGQAVTWGQKTVDNSLKAADLITLAAGALKNVNGEMVVDLSKIKMNINTDGVKQMSEDVDKALNVFAQELMDMLDSMISLLEVIVAMEQLGDIDTNFDGEIDLSELFDDWEILGPDAKLFSKEALTSAQAILDQANALGPDSDLYKALDAVKINGYSMREMLDDVASGIRDLPISAEAYQSVLNAFYQAAMSNDWDEDNVGESLRKILSSAGLDSYSIDVGEAKTFYVTGSSQYVLNWEGANMDDAMAALEKAGITEKDQRKAIFLAIDKLNSGEIEVGTEQYVSLDYAVHLATGSITIGNEVIKDGKHKGLLKGTFGNSTFYNESRAKLEKTVQDALKFEELGMNVSISEDCNITATYSQGTATIKYDNAKGKYIGYNKEECGSLQEAIQSYIKAGFANEKDAGSYEIDGKTYLVTYNEALGISYTFTPELKIVYNGNTFEDLGSLLKYLATTDLIKDKSLWTTTDKDIVDNKTVFEVKENGVAKVTIDYDDDNVNIDYTFGGQTVNSVDDFKQLLALQTLTKESLGGKLDTTTNTAEFTYAGNNVVCSFEYGENGVTFKYSCPSLGIETDSLEALKSAIAVKQKTELTEDASKNGKIAMDGATFTYTIDAEGKVKVELKDGGKLSPEDAEKTRLTLELNMQKLLTGEATIDLDLKATIVSAITEAVQSLNSLSADNLTSVGTSLLTIASALSAISQIDATNLSTILSSLNGLTSGDGETVHPLELEVTAKIKDYILGDIDPNTLVSSLVAKVVTFTATADPDQLTSALKAVISSYDPGTDDPNNLVSALTAIVTSYSSDPAEPNKLVSALTAYISEYKDGENVEKPTLDDLILFISDIDTSGADAALEAWRAQQEANGVTILVSTFTDGEGANFNKSDIVSRMQLAVEELNSLSGFEEGLDFSSVYNQDLVISNVLSSLGPQTAAATSAITDYMQSLFTNWNNEGDFSSYLSNEETILLNAEAEIIETNVPEEPVEVPGTLKFEDDEEDLLIEDRVEPLKIIVKREYEDEEGDISTEESEKTIPVNVDPEINTDEFLEELREGGEAGGQSLNQGTAEGIKENVDEATDASKDAGGQVVEAGKEGLGSHSPSIYMIAAGKDLILGLVQGITENQEQAITTSTQLGTAVIEAIGTALSEGLNTLAEGINEAVESVDKSYTELETKTEQVAGSIRSHWDALVNLITAAVSLIQSLVLSLLEKISITWTIGSEGGKSDLAGFGSGTGIDPNREMTALTEYMDKMLSTMEHNKKDDTFKVTMPTLTIDTSTTEVNIDDIGKKVLEEAAKEPVKEVKVSVGTITSDLTNVNVDVASINEKVKTETKANPISSLDTVVNSITPDLTGTTVDTAGINKKVLTEVTKNPISNLNVAVSAITPDVSEATPADIEVFPKPLIIKSAKAKIEKLADPLDLTEINDLGVLTLNENASMVLTDVKAVPTSLSLSLDSASQVSIDESTPVVLSKPIKVPAEVDTTDAETSISSLKTLIGEIKQEKEPLIFVDINPAITILNALIKAIDAIKLKKAPQITIDTTVAKANLNEIIDILDTIIEKALSLMIRITTAQETYQTSEFIKTIMNNLITIENKKTQTITISGGNWQKLISDLNDIASALERIQGASGINIDVNGGPEETPKGKEGETPEEGETSKENNTPTQETPSELGDKTSAEEVTAKTITAPEGEINGETTSQSIDAPEGNVDKVSGETAEFKNGTVQETTAENVDVPEGTKVAIEAAIDLGEAGQNLTLTATIEVEMPTLPAEVNSKSVTWTINVDADPVPAPPSNARATWTITVNYKRGSGGGGLDAPGGFVKASTGNFGLASGTLGLASGTLGQITGPAHAQSTLMGELGPELVVSKGRYFVAGQNGAEMVDLDKDAIVFNHLQTEQLLKNGMSKGRGRAVTNERNAAAFAKGNISGGPAMASASAALAVLKQIRSMWESFLNATAKDLAGAGGSGGGGGGGKDKGGKGSDAGRKSFIEDVERWYNLMQEIAKLEKVINHEETLRAKLEGDLHKNGSAYYKSLKESLSAIQKEIKAQEELNISRREYFNLRRKQLNEDNGPFNQLYEFDELGQLKYKSDTKIKGSKATNGYAFLADLMAQDPNTGKPKYTVELQYKILKKAGFAKYMKFDSSGNEIKLGGTDSDDGPSEDDYNTYYSSMVQAFWDRVEALKSEMQTLYDSVAEGENSLLEKELARNELLEAMYDNLKELENSVLNAIEDMKQREIDALLDERDKLEEATGKYIDGLSEALDKERLMYDTQENQNELDTKKRRLGILLRSGASAEDIYSLQKEITESEKNMYFDAQLAQIDAILLASDLEIERLDNQILIMQDTLDFLKEMGLLWYLVYDVMGKSSAEITLFVMGNDSLFWNKSPLESAQTYENTLFEAEQWKSFSEDQHNISEILTWNLQALTADALSTYSDTMSKQHDKDDFWKNNKKRYEDKFTLVFEETGDRTKAATAASQMFETDKAWNDRETAAGNRFVGADKEEVIDKDDTYHWIYKYKKEEYTGLNAEYLNKGEQWYFESRTKEKHKWNSKGVCEKCGHKKPKEKKSSGGSGDWSSNNCNDSCSGVCKGQLSGGTSCSKNCANNCSGGCKTGCLTTCTNSCKGGPNDKTGGYNTKKFGKASGMNNHPSLAKGNHTLIGELGPELIVSKGQYHIAGRSGAEFVNLPDDAIVFNHMQTRSLLRNGRTGRGKSVVNDARSIASSSNTNKVTALKNNSDPFSQLYEYDSLGRLKYKSNTKIQGSNLTSAYAFLADLMSSDAKGNSKYSAKQQYEILKKAGFEKYMKYDSSGNEIKLGGTGNKNDLNTYYRSMVQAFWDSVEARQSDMSALYASVAESERTLQQLELERDKMLQEVLSSGSIIIENASVNMNVQKIANDYDAKRAGEQALNEMLRIANKTSAANNIRR